jgi:hypothetical protein
MRYLLLSCIVLLRCVLVMAGVLLFFCGPVQARSGRYQLVQHLTNQRGIDGRLLRLSLRDRQTGRILWRRLCADLEYIDDNGTTRVLWSGDGRALIISMIDVYPGTQFRILCWRAGHPPRLIGTRDLFAGFDDWRKIMWSPDSQRFSFIVGGSGGFDVDNVNLLCVNVSTGGFTFGPDGIVRYHWIGPRLIRYVTGTVKTDTRHPERMVGIEILHPARVWRCP